MLLIIITYLAGVLTILSPCILPVLPFVFSRSQHSFAKSGIPLLAGMSLTFSLFSALAVVGGEWIAQANEWGRILAIVFLSLFGVALIFPSLSEKLVAPLTRLGSSLGSGSSQNTFWGSFVIGIGTGLLWAPCAGPILGLVLTGAAAQGDVGKSVGLLLAYSLGAATSLAAALVAGNKFLGTLKKFLGVDQIIKKILGVAVLLGVVAIVFKLDRTILTQFSKLETTSLENKLLALVEPKKDEVPTNSMMMMSAKNENQQHIEGELPELTGAVIWLNSKPLTKEDLLGKVVLVDFWTYSCINCLRTLPYVKVWAEKYKNDDFVVIGVHTPEFAFEKNADNVRAALKDLGITYPVAVDSNYKIWNAFHNQYWPAHYFIDRQGRIRDHHFGEGRYEESENIIRALLTENGGTISAVDSTTASKVEGVQAASSAADVQSPETYLGYNRAANFVASPNTQQDKVVTYSFPKSLQVNQWSIEGSWLIADEKAILKKATGKIRFRFHARDLHLVLGGEKPAKFKVSIDGHPPGPDHGIDTDSEGFGQVKSHRLYQLIRLQQNADTDHLFEIEFLNPEVEAFAFTFG